MMFCVCECACVCPSMFACVCVCIAFGLWTVAWIEFADFASCLQLALAHSLCFSFSLFCPSLPLPHSLSLSASLEYWSSWSSSCSSCSSRLVLSMHSSTFSSCQRQRSWATFSGLAVLNLVRLLLLLPPHRSYLLHPTPPCLPYTFAGRAGRSCGTHFSQFLPSTRSISTSFRMPHLLLVLFPSLSLSLSASWLLACVSLCLFWKSP